MGFVKLDCGMLDSTLWPDREAREIFITALLMAKPKQLVASAPQLEVRSLEPTGFEVPAGWYGFIEAAGSGIVRRAGLEMEVGMNALERLGAAEPDSRTPDFEGRRLVRIDGGYVALNYQRYRDKDHTAAIRAKKYRDKKKPSKRQAQVAAESRSRERRGAKAYNNGDEAEGDRIAAEGLDTGAVPG